MEALRKKTLVVKDQITRGCAEFRILAGECVASVESWLTDPSNENAGRCLNAASTMLCDKQTNEYGAADKYFLGKVYGAAHLATAALYFHRNKKDVAEKFLRFAA